MRGLIPTAWYPNQLALTPDGRQLAVATLLGVGSGAELKDAGAPLRPRLPRHGPRRCRCRTRRSSPATRRPSRRTITSRRRARSSQPADGAHAAAPAAVPRRAGDPSLIEHVVYIIKENRTYDQLFGDLPRGNGEPSFVMFGEDVTPNHRKLATEFVLLDNFYATGGNSGDGHQWVTQASETSYALWPGYVGRSYPFDGTDPIAYANTGFLWDLALAREQDRARLRRVRRTAAGNRSRRSASGCSSGGATATTSPSEWSITAPLAPLNKVLARNYPPVLAEPSRTWCGRGSS